MSEYHKQRNVEAIVEARDRDTPKRTMAQIAQEAIDIQNACNPLGLTKTFAKVTQELQELLGDSSAVRNHPVWHAWLDKLVDMAGLDEDAAGIAYVQCEELAQADNDARIPGVCPGHLAKLAGRDCVIQVRGWNSWTTVGDKPFSLSDIIKEAKRLFSGCDNSVQLRIADLDGGVNVFAYFDVKDGQIVPSTYKHVPGDED